MIVIKNLKKYFPLSNGILKAVDGISLSIPPGKTWGVVGESGCGKTTLGKLLLRLYEPTEGSLHFDNLDILSLSSSDLKKWRRNAQIIFQNPHTSLNPRMRAEDIVLEPLLIHKLPFDSTTIGKIFDRVGLNNNHRYRYPHELSGGQRQRINIARALILNPRFIVCDESVSALDLSTQIQIINLLKELQQERNLSYLFISHNLRIIRYICDFVSVMYLGKIVESSTADALYQAPLHPYTQALFSAIPPSDPFAAPETSRPHFLLKGEPPFVLPPPLQSLKGCPFSGRCPKMRPLCQETVPILKEITPGHPVACHQVPVSYTEMS